MQVEAGMAPPHVQGHACTWDSPTLVHQKCGRANILYTRAEITDCMPHRSGGALYAVCTSSKSHNCCTGMGRFPKRPVGLGR